MIDLIIGIVGMTFILIAFILDEFVRKFNQNTIPYNLLNIVGSLLLTYYAFLLDSWPFMVLNIVWLVVASFKLTRIIRK